MILNFRRSLFSANALIPWSIATNARPQSRVW
jgi:hypothetical protein